MFLSLAQQGRDHHDMVLLLHCGTGDELDDIVAAIANSSAVAGESKGDGLVAHRAMVLPAASDGGDDPLLAAGT